MTTTKKEKRYGSSSSAARTENIINDYRRAYHKLLTHEQLQDELREIRERWGHHRLQVKHQVALYYVNGRFYDARWRRLVWCHIEDNQIKVAHVDSIDDYQSLDEKESFHAYAIEFPCSRIAFIPVEKNKRKEHLENGLLSDALLSSAMLGNGIHLILKNRKLMGLTVSKSTYRPKKIGTVAGDNRCQTS